MKMCGPPRPELASPSQLPYLVTVKAENASDGQSFIAYSLNDAPVQFEPLKQTLFANNATIFTPVDGIMTKAESAAGREITGFVALPVDAIGAYTSGPKH